MVAIGLCTPVSYFMEQTEDEILEWIKTYREISKPTL